MFTFRESLQEWQARTNGHPAMWRATSRTLHAVIRHRFAPLLPVDEDSLVRVGYDGDGE